MSLDYYTLKTSHLAVVVLLIAALVGCYRARRWPRIVQLVGAGCMATALAIGYLTPLRPDPGTNQISFGAAWQTQEVLSSAGLMIFAIGYALQMSRHPDVPPKHGVVRM
jgi:hypothetical protein